MTQLCSEEWCMYILPALSKNSLLSIRTFADDGYLTIFHTGAMVHDHNNITVTSTKSFILQGCLDGNSLWHVPLTNLSSILHNLTVHHTNNIYDLPSTEHTLVFRPKSLYSQWFTMAISPHFPDSRPPMWQKTFPNPMKLKKGRSKFNKAFVPLSPKKTT